MNYSPSKTAEHKRGEQGAAIVVAILSLLLVTLLGVALMSMGLTGRSIADNDTQTTEVFFVTEGGLQHGLRIINTLGKANFSKILKNGTDNDPWDNLVNGDQITTIVDPILGAGNALPGTPGAYRVSVRDDNDGDGDVLTDSNGRLLVTAMGTGRDGAATTLEVTYGTVVLPGFLVDGNLRINGNPHIIGVGGSVHSNGTMDIDGHPCASQYFGSASNIIDQDQADTGPGCNGNDVRPSSPNIPVPDYDPANWASDPVIPDPDFIFRHDGVVFKKTTGVFSGTGISNAVGTSVLPAPSGYVRVGATCSSAPCGSGNFKETISGTEVTWDFDASADKKEWKVSGNAMHGGRTYYFQGSNLAISGSPGSNASHVVVTLLADGYINISGNPFLTPKDADIQMMAGNDLEINGNLTGSDTNFHGLHYARNQVKFSGNPIINGQVIAKSRNDEKFPMPNGVNLVPLGQGGFMDVSGNPTINYDGGGSNTALRIMSWREIRN